MIESYKFGEIIVNRKKYTSDIIIFSNGNISSWWRKQGHKVLIEDIKKIIDVKPNILIIGTGNSGIVTIPKETKDYLKSKNIKLIEERTKKACEIFNKLIDKERIAAGFHLTC